MGVCFFVGVGCGAGLLRGVFGGVGWLGFLGVFWVSVGVICGVFGWLAFARLQLSGYQVVVWKRGARH